MIGGVACTACEIAGSTSSTSMLSIVLLIIFVFFLLVDTVVNVRALRKALINGSLLDENARKEAAKLVGTQS